MKPAIKTALGVAIVSALSIAATITNSPVPAHAGTNTIANGWIDGHWLKAYSGGGCAYWTNASPGNALYSGACGRTDVDEDLSYRILTRSDGQKVMQIAEVAAGVDLTPAGGTWRWEVANSTTHVFPVDQFTDGIYLMFQGDHFMGPNGNNLPLRDITPISDEQNAGWGIVVHDIHTM